MLRGWVVIRVNDSTIFDDVTDCVLVAAELINEMLPPVNMQIDNHDKSDAKVKSVACKILQQIIYTV